MLTSWWQALAQRMAARRSARHHALLVAQALWSGDTSAYHLTETPEERPSSAGVAFSSNRCTCQTWGEVDACLRDCQSTRGLSHASLQEAPSTRVIPARHRAELESMDEWSRWQATPDDESVHLVVVSNESRDVAETSRVWRLRVREPRQR